jgi:adenine deaminase
MTKTIEGNIVNIENRTVSFGKILVADGHIKELELLSTEKKGAPYLLPGFIDSHVHVESSMLIPSEFARMAVVHGTVATISDPHEIANVCGIEGVDFMIENGRTVPFKFHFGAPSCVPATVFETAGDAIDAMQVDALLARPEIHYLSEMMNFPGVLHEDPEVMQKIASAKKFGKPVDGHAPGLRGEQARKYIEAGISTDHECFTSEEALDKLQLGMKILIREGSAAKNFEALADLLHEHYDNMMFCSDDKHPDSLELGHINKLCARAVAKGVEVFKVLQAACINPVKHYKMKVGLLQKNDPADMIAVSDLVHFDVLETYISGQLVAANGKTLIERSECKPINRFECGKIKPIDIIVKHKGEKLIPVIEALDGQLITNRLDLEPLCVDGNIVADTKRDILKIVVVNRYRQAPVSAAFIHNIGLRQGAMASSVAHDSHNIVAVGVDDESICRAVNLVVGEKGGISAVNEETEMVIGLPVAGLMTGEDGYEVSARYSRLDDFAKKTLGSKMGSPFMTLSFMALLVIPSLKLSDKGLFDGETFRFVNQVS